MTLSIRSVFLACLAAAAAQMTGCAQLQMSAPKASIENTQKVRSAGLAPAAVGKFALDPKKDAALDKQISMRGSNTVSSPVEGSFAQYLKATLSAELQAAGLLKADSSTVITGLLTESNVETMGTGKGSLGAKFTVTRGTSVRYDKELKVSSTWETSIVAGIAVPAAAREYENLYKKLVGALLDDPDFRKALAP